MKNLFCIIVFISLKAVAQREAGYISKGNEYYLQLKFDLAESQYRQALEIAPHNAEAKYNLANALMQQKKFKEAIELYNDVATGNNKNLQAAAHYNAGVSYSKQKDLPNSIQAYKAALRINPNDRQARENLQKALSELKKQQQEEKNKQNKGGGGGMNRQEAENKLKELEQKEKDLQRRLQNQGKGKGTGGSKDW